MCGALVRFHDPRGWHHRLAEVLEPFGDLLHRRRRRRSGRTGGQAGTGGGGDHLPERPGHAGAIPVSARLATSWLPFPEHEAFEEAIGCYEQALAIRREIGDRYGEGKTLRSFGYSYQKIGQRDRAARCWREAAVAMRDAGDHEEAGRMEELAASAQARRRRWWRGNRG